MLYEPQNDEEWAEAERRGYERVGNAVLVRKLGIRNNCLGLSGEQLREVTDLGRSLNKVQGPDANYGHGGRRSTLGSNHYGVQYWVCSPSTYDPGVNSVYQMTLTGRKLDDGRNDYGAMILQEDDPQDQLELVDVDHLRSLYLERGMEKHAALFETDRGWFNVVQFGMHPLEDTTANIFGDFPPGIDRAKEETRLWLQTRLFERFFDIGDAQIMVENRLLHPDNREKRSDLYGFTRVRTLWDAFRDPEQFEHVETIHCTGGVKIHVGLHRSDFKAKGKTFFDRRSTIFATVYRGEMYFVQRYANGNRAVSALFRDRPMWANTAILFGLPPSVSTMVSMIIEMPPNAFLETDEYRVRLTSREGAKLDFDPTVMAAEFRDRMPDWLRALVDEANAPKSDIGESIQRKLEKYIEDTAFFILVL